ncbi:MAG: peptide ABC transporter substrate-binding protein [Oscillospiraceae bacterium]|nr:peptide ABC transporter substrate-binding protein [Oscillospiraceae bacterium]
MKSHKPIRTMLALLLTVASLAWCLVSCGKDTGEGREIFYPIDRMPEALDPAIAAGREEAMVLLNCFEGLVRLGGQGDMATDIVPGVAERWEISEDGRRYTFYLRQDTNWKLPAEAKALLGEEAFEGFDTRVTAADFVFGFRRALRAETRAPGAALLFPILNAPAVHSGAKREESLGVAEIDEFTLEISLEQPSASFLYTLTQSVAAPCSETYFEATGGRYGLAPNYLLCNGPFYLSHWEGSTVRIRRNEGYAGHQRVLPAAVTLRVQPAPEERLRLLNADSGYSAAMLPSGKGEAEPPGGARQIPLRSATLTLIFQCGKAPFSNTKLRTALCAAIDASALGFAGAEQAQPGLLPGCCIVGDEELRALAGLPKGIAYDPARAQKLWKEGLEEGRLEGLTLTLLCPPEYDRPMRQLLQQWQSAFGLSALINVESPEPEDYAKRLAQGEFDIALVILQAESAFALSFLQHYAESGGAGNLMRYRSGVLDGLLAGAARLEDQEQAARGLLQAEEHLLQNGVTYPFAALDNRMLLAKGVSGLLFSPAGEPVSFINGTILKK